MIFLPLLLLTFLLQCGLCKVAEVWDACINDFLVDSKEVSYVKEDFVHVGVILSGIQGTSSHKRAVILKLEEMLQSILKNLQSTRRRIHFIIFTDEDSRPHVTNVFRQEMGRYISESILFDLQVVGSILFGIEFDHVIVNN